MYLADWLLISDVVLIFVSLFAMGKFASHPSRGGHNTGRPYQAQMPETILMFVAFALLIGMFVLFPFVMWYETLIVTQKVTVENVLAEYQSGNKGARWYDTRVMINSDKQRQIVKMDEGGLVPAAGETWEVQYIYNKRHEFCQHEHAPYLVSVKFIQKME